MDEMSSRRPSHQGNACTSSFQCNAHQDMQLTSKHIFKSGVYSLVESIICECTHTNISNLNTKCFDSPEIRSNLIVIASNRDRAIKWFLALPAPTFFSFPACTCKLVIQPWRGSPEKKSVPPTRGNDLACAYTITLRYTQ